MGAWPEVGRAAGRAGVTKPQRVTQPDRGYLNWHRTLARGCYATDIDLVEARYVDGQPVPALLTETKLGRERITRFQAGVLRALAAPRERELPAVTVHYDGTGQRDTFRLDRLFVAPINAAGEDLLDGRRVFTADEWHAVLRDLTPP